jgi:hypothetical protein
LIEVHSWLEPGRPLGWLDLDEALPYLLLLAPMNQRVSLDQPMMQRRTVTSPHTGTQYPALVTDMCVEELLRWPGFREA